MREVTHHVLHHAIHHPKHIHESSSLQHTTTITTTLQTHTHHHDYCLHLDHDLWPHAFFVEFITLRKINIKFHHPLKPFFASYKAIFPNWTPWLRINCRHPRLRFGCSPQTNYANNSDTVTYFKRQNGKRRIKFSYHSHHTEGGQRTSLRLQRQTDRLINR